MNARGLSAVAACALMFTASPARAAVKVACVGDSITASSSRYPTWLGQNLGTAYEVRNFGVSGTTMLKATSTPYWNTTNFTASSSYLPDIVIIMLGTNDSKTFNWGPFGSQYETDYRAMVNHYRGLSSRPVVYVMTSPPCFNFSGSYQPNVIANEIVPTVRRISSSMSAPLVEIFEPMKDHPEYFGDGTHPTTEGSQLIASIVNKVVRANAGDVTPGPSAVTASTSDTNVPGNSVDKNLATRWSGAGDGAWIQYDLGTTRSVSKVGVAVYQGNMRRNRFDLQVSTCCGNWTTVWTGESSGTTTLEAQYDFTNIDGRYVRYVGHGSNVGTYNSVTEVSIFAAPATATPTPTPTPTPAATPTPTPTGRPTPGGDPIEVTPPGTSVTASTSDGNLPANAVDNSLTSRWSANGDGQWLQLDLGATQTVTHVRIATYNGNLRRGRFDVQVATMLGAWTTVLTGVLSSGTTTAEETYELTDTPARYVRYVGHGNTLNGWNSVTEISIFAAP
jgi:lysophospholipase L1-like esterase